MAEVVVFHHALGLTEGIGRFADTLREAGHVVHTPDLFDGQTFVSIGEGVAHAQEIGFGTVLERAGQLVSSLPSAVVYAGFSLGVLPAQMLTQTRPGARGALLYYSCIPAAEFGSWPSGVPVQVHGKDADPYFVDEGDLDAARALVDSDGAELYLYPGSDHYFLDPTLPTYDQAAAELVLSRSLELLARASSVE